jgi:cell division protein FtsB
MTLVAAILILAGVVVWRLLRLEAQLKQQREVIEELHQRVWQLEDLVALLHQNRESHTDSD